MLTFIIGMLLFSFLVYYFLFVVGLTLKVLAWIFGGFIIVMLGIAIGMLWFIWPIILLGALIMWFN